jgi:hypothetical protein
MHRGRFLAFTLLKEIKRGIAAPSDLQRIVLSVFLNSLNYRENGNWKILESP